MAGRLTSELVVRLIDHVTGPAKGVAAAIKAVGNAAPLANAQARLGKAIEANNEALAASRGRLVDAAAGFFALKAAIAAPINNAVEFETVLEDIGQKANIPIERLSALGRQITGIARATNQSTMEIAKSVDALLGMGASEDVALTASAPIGKAATAYRASTDDLAKASWAAVDNLKVPAGQIGAALDAMAAAGKSGAFELRDMATYFPSLGAAYQGLGQTGVGAVADIAAALQVVRKGTGDASSAATNLGNVIQKIYAPDTINNFKKKGVNVFKEMQKAAKRGLTPIEAIAEITEKTLKGDLSKMGDLFGDAQVQGGMRSLIQNMQEYRRIREEAKSANGVVDADFERRIQTGAGAMARWNAAVTNVSLALGGALLPALTDVVNAIVPYIDRAGQWAAENPKVVTAIVATTGALIALKVASIGVGYGGRIAYGGLLLMGKGGVLALRGLTSPVTALMGTVGRVRGAFTALRAASSTRGVAMQAQASARAALVDAQANYKRALSMRELAKSGSVVGMNAKQATANLAQMGAELTKAQAGMKAANAAAAASPGALGGMGRAFSALVSPMALVRGAMMALRVALIGTGIGAIVLGIALAGMWIYNNWSGLKAMFSGIGEGLRAAFEPAGPMLDAIGNSISGIVDWFSNLVGKVDMTDQQWRELGVTIGTAIGDAITGMIQKFEEFIAYVASIPERIKAFFANLDLSSWIQWPSLPSWLGGGGDAPAAPANPAGGPAPARRGRGAPTIPVDGARAGGGPVAAGRTYLVGELGPELFRPRVSGEIVPNDRLGEAAPSRSTLPTPEGGVATVGTGAHPAPVAALPAAAPTPAPQMADTSPPAAAVDARQPDPARPPPVNVTAPSVNVDARPEAPRPPVVNLAPTAAPEVAVPPAPAVTVDTRPDVAVTAPPAAPAAPPPAAVVDVVVQDQRADRPAPEAAQRAPQAAQDRPEPAAQPAQDRPQAAPAPAPAPVTITATVPVSLTINRTPSVDEVVRETMAKIEGQLRERLRGAFADPGLSF